MTHLPVEIIKNNNGVYLLHKESSFKDKRNALINILSSIANNPNYSILEKLKITENALHDDAALAINF